LRQAPDNRYSPISGGHPSMNVHVTCTSTPEVLRRRGAWRLPRGVRQLGVEVGHHCLGTLARHHRRISFTPHNLHDTIIGLLG